MVRKIIAVAAAVLVAAVAWVGVPAAALDGGEPVAAVPPTCC
jgi:hypothetical protein